MKTSPLDSFAALRLAYELLVDFKSTIDTQLDGDHPMTKSVERWLTWYEKNEDAMDIEGVPV